MTKDSRKAKNCLTGRSFRVVYGDAQRGTPTYVDEYPEYIPAKDELIRIEDKDYVVASRAFDVNKNIIYLDIIPRRQYEYDQKEFRRMLQMRSSKPV